MHGRGHQESQNSDDSLEIMCGQYKLWSQAPVPLELNNRKKYDEKVLSSVPQGLYQIQLLNIYR